MNDKARYALKAFSLYAHTKHGAREINRHLDTMERGTDDMLDVTETVEHVVMGTMDSLAVQETAFKAFNWAPRINKKLWKKFPWKIL